MWKACPFLAQCVTVKTRASVFVTPPPVAEIVRLVLPATALEAAVSVSVLPLLLFAAMRAGSKVAVTPFGSPVTERVIVEANPLNVAPEMLA